MGQDAAAEGRRRWRQRAPRAHDSDVPAARLRAASTRRARPREERVSAGGVPLMRLPTPARRMLVAALAVVSSVSVARAQRLLVPMDDAQQNHLKAYGLTYAAIKA